MANQVEVWCGVYGEATVFPVMIAGDARVYELQEAIVNGKREVNDHFKVDPSTLILYLARKDKDWLPDNDDVTRFLRAGVSAEYKVMMRPSWQLNKPELLGSDFKTAVEVIHVLVELPEPAAGVMSDPQGLKELVESSVCKVMDDREEKRSVYSLSDLNSKLGERIMKKMRLQEDCPDFDEPVNTSIAGYQWIPNVAESEESQRDGYMAYLRLHLKTLLDRGDFQLVDIADDKSLLSIVDPRLPFRMNGTADVLLVNRRAKNPLNKLAGIRLVIELKKQVKSSHFPQALGQLVSCSLKAPLHCFPVSLLTDLNDHWHFSWFNEECVLAQVTLNYPKNAIDFIVAAVSEREGSVPFRVPFIGPPLKKLKVDDFLPMPSDGADEMMERYELMADELEPEFLEERRMEYAQHLVQSMPMYAHMFA